MLEWSITIIMALLMGLDNWVDPMKVLSPLKVLQAPEGDWERLLQAQLAAVQLFLHGHQEVRFHFHVLSQRHCPFF